MEKLQYNTILSVQSMVCAGYVGNNIAALAIQLHGNNVAWVPTVMYSNHTGHPQVYGTSVAIELFADLLKGLEAINVLADCRYIISGYCDNEDQIILLAAFIKKIKLQQPYCYVYDPVFGDFRTNGLYVNENVVARSLENLLNLCDVLTPNHFEMEYILGRTVRTEADFLAAVLAHSILKHKCIVLTSAFFDDTDEGIMEVVCFEKGRVTRFKGRKMLIESTGTGDLFTAVIACQLNKGHSIEQAISVAMRYVEQGLAYAIENGQTELTAAALVENISVLYT